MVAPAGVSPKGNSMFATYWARTEQTWACRVIGASEPDWSAEADAVVDALAESASEAGETVAQGEIARAARAWGAFTQEAREAFKRLVEAGELARVGRRWARPWSCPSAA